MKTSRFFATAFLATLFFVTAPSLSHAYGVTDRAITKLSPTLTMYTLEFEFGFLNAEMWMPMAASKTTVGGNTTSSLVLSNEPIQDSKYYVPKGKNGSFTLLVLEEHAVGGAKGSVNVNELPITLQKTGDKKVVKVFTAEELKDFRVPKK
jgi:hypothetical protein